MSGSSTFTVHATGRHSSPPKTAPGTMGASRAMATLTKPRFQSRIR